MDLNKHVDTVQLPDGSLRVVHDTDLGEVKVFHSMKPEPLAVFGVVGRADDSENISVAIKQGVEYANGYAHGIREGE